MRKYLAYLPFKRFRHPPPIVAVLRLSGPIGAVSRFQPGLSMASTAKAINEAFSMHGVEAVALSINSPGGSPVQSALILKRIRALAEEKDIPVIAFAEDVAASGGYMLALAGDEIYAHDASVIGSIGVIYSGFGFTGVMEKLGVDRRLYTAGESKAIGDPFSPEKQEDIERIKDIQVQIHDFFKTVVRERRGRRLKGPRAKVFSGDVWVGAQAQKMGLIDGIGDLRTILRERFGEKVKIRLVSNKKGRLSSLLGFTRGFDEVPDENGSWAEGLIAAIEARIMWSRFGL